MEPVYFDVSLQGWDELEAAWRQAPDIVREEMATAMWDAEMLLQSQTQELTPAGISTAGGLRGSIFSLEPEVLADSVIGVTGSSLNYAASVELGTKPHPVSDSGIRALADWVRLKLGYSEEEAEKMAHGIAWKIRHYGTKPVGMFHRAYDANQTKVAMMFGGARDRIAARLAGA